MLNRLVVFAKPVLLTEEIVSVFLYSDPEVGRRGNKKGGGKKWEVDMQEERRTTGNWKMGKL
jgi:hypothetical protein